MKRKMGFSAPRGFVEMHVLRVLETPHHGYEIIKHIEQECGFWKPSPGSIYPMLQKLKKSRFISEKDSGNRKVYTITSSGRARLNEFDSRKAEAVDKINALLGMIGEKPDSAGFELFRKIRSDPVKTKKALKLKEQFLEDMRRLAEE